MCLNDQLRENALINSIANKFAKSPLKLNSTHESDAEIIDIGNSDGDLLAVTTDALAEELSSGLYDDPYLAGWMLVTVNLSDLAAVGALPVGILISLTLKPSHDTTFIEKLADGISDACRAANTFVLGGDTNQGEADYLSGCALGLIDKNKVMSRIGARPGDRIYLTAPAGCGNMFAFSQLNRINNDAEKIAFKPSARLREGQLIRDYAGCCIDTSDGVIHAIDTLMRLNRTQAILYNNWDSVIDPRVSEICRRLAIPSWLALAGVHGEFELCFTVSAKRTDEFLAEARGQGWSPVLIGEIAPGSGVAVRQDNSDIFLDTTKIRNLFYEEQFDIHKYSESLIKLAGCSGII